jgi:DNA-directed RNA polymerase specialized sigma24 family protein
LELLTILAARHTDWIRMARSFGADQELAQDIVQEMYVRLYKYVEDAEKIMYNEKEVNTFFVYVTLRNMYTSLMKAKARFEFVDISTIEDDLIFEEANEEAEKNLSACTIRFGSSLTNGIGTTRRSLPSTTTPI